MEEKKNFNQEENSRGEGEEEKFEEEMGTEKKKGREEGKVKRMREWEKKNGHE